MFNGLPIIGEEMVLLEDVSPTSGSSYTFTGISQNYDDLLIVFRTMATSTGGTLSCYFNGDETLTNYARLFWRYIETVNPQQGGSGQDAQFGRSGTGVDGQDWTGTLWIPEYSRSDRKKTAQGQGMFGNVNLGNYRNVLWNNAAAIYQIKIAEGVGPYTFIAPSQMLLYGVRRRRIL